MIITFDGNVFVGKTSLIKEFAFLCDFNIVSEPGVFIKEEVLCHAVTVEKQAMSLQLKYLEAENIRCSYINVDRTNLLDRSFVSMAAHIFALNFVNGIDIRNWFLDEVKSRIELGRVIIPDIFCFIRCNHKIINERALKNKDRNTDPVYYLEGYLNAIEIFNQAWIKKVNGITIDTGTALPVVLAKTLIKGISVSSFQRRSEEGDIVGYLREVLMREVKNQRG